jgi:hypothetical protein
MTFMTFVIENRENLMEMCFHDLYDLLDPGSPGPGHKGHNILSKQKRKIIGPWGHKGQEGHENTSPLKNGRIYIHPCSGMYRGIQWWETEDRSSPERAKPSWAPGVAQAGRRPIGGVPTSTRKGKIWSRPPEP